MSKQDKSVAWTTGIIMAVLVIAFGIMGFQRDSYRIKYETQKVQTDFFRKKAEDNERKYELLKAFIKTIEVGAKENTKKFLEALEK